MQTYSEAVSARLLGRFPVRRDGAVVTPTTSWQRKILGPPALPDRDAVIASALAEGPRAGRIPARLRASGIRLPRVRQAGRLTRTMPRPGDEDYSGLLGAHWPAWPESGPGITINGMIISHEGCKLFALIPCST